MKARTNTNKKSSARKKLIPAAGSLMISAAMLSTSTYAWFTMSREVEVTGIKMTASVPEGYEVSLGKGMLSSTSLIAGEGNATLVAAPDNNTDNDLDWTHAVAVCDYYDFGYLLPASSINGTDIWYTNNATQAGRAVDANATFAQADTAASPKMTTYNKITSATHDADFAEEHQKGYYIDIPVWFRSSSSTASTLGVKVTITAGRNDGSGPTGTGNLYKAARVAILDANGAANTSTADKVIADSTVYTSASALQGAYYNRYTAAQTSDDTLITYPQAVKAAGSLNGANATGTTLATAITNANSLYGTVSFLNQTSESAGTVSGDAVVALAAPTSGNNYSAAVQKTIRVWLEGEDVNCWDSNAAQSFTIDLTFTKIGTMADATAANVTP
ncbi:MAG: hypothetical protein IJJ76_02980 [Ruminococcus sp.]|uniref:hypothetical protein n=1 Tax=Ruminococcus sp. TaxID=41978 RepID=UPI0025E398A8|nr:hypothetical protein [Ruminococcus sp.]MBR0528713.1 hypothetical protein [Ruminococcus sp.]